MWPDGTLWLTRTLEQDVPLAGLERLRDDERGLVHGVRGEENRPATRQHVWPDVLSLAALDVDDRQRLRHAAGGWNLPETRPGDAEDDRIIGRPGGSADLCAGKQPLRGRQQTDGLSRATCERYFSDLFLGHECQPETVRREEWCAGALGVAHRLGRKRVHRSTIEPEHIVTARDVDERLPVG